MRRTRRHAERLILAAVALVIFPGALRQGMVGSASSNRQGVTVPTLGPAPLLRILPSVPSLAEQCTGTLTTSTGGAITTVRAATKTCTKSDTSTVVLSANQPSVEADGLKIQSGSPADLVTVANPIPDGVSFCLQATVKPTAASWPAATNAVMSTRSYFSANSFSFTVNSSGFITLNVIDSAGNNRTFNSTTTISGAAHKVRACAAGSTITVTVDGAAVAGTLNGTGTGVISSQGPTIALGALQVSGANYLDGWIRDVCIGLPGACN